MRKSMSKLDDLWQRTARTLQATKMKVSQPVTSACEVTWKLLCDFVGMMILKQCTVMQATNSK